MLSGYAWDRSTTTPGKRSILDEALGGLNSPGAFSMPQKQNNISPQLKSLLVIFFAEYLVANMTTLEYNITKGRCDYVKFELVGKNLASCEIKVAIHKVWLLNI